jgi:hypothetical protein
MMGGKSDDSKALADYLRFYSFHHCIDLDAAVIPIGCTPPPWYTIINYIST